MEVFKEFGIEASHSLPNVAPDHKCARLHGHSFRIRVTVTGDVGVESGWVIDFADISAAWQPLHDRLDHRHLNDIEGLANPTSEHLARWIWTELVGVLPGLSAVEVRETPTSGCTYRGD